MESNYKSSTAAAGLEAILLQEKTSQIQKNPTERLIFSNGFTRKGRFILNRALSGLTTATVFNTGETPVFVRFSTMTANPAEGVKGMSVKFLTDAGDWDLVCSNTPVAALEDGKKFPEYLTALRNTEDTSEEWAFFGRNPETLHYFLISKSARSIATPVDEMDGYSGNAYSLIAADGTKRWVKFHFKSNPADRQKWTVFTQILTEEAAKELPYNPFDATKVWLHADCPLTEIGEIIIEKENLPASEALVFSPANIINGIGFSPDRILLSRLAVYGDAQRKRLGENYPAKSDFSAFENAIQSLGGSEADYTGYAFDPYIQAGMFYTKALKTADERTILVENIIKSARSVQSPAKPDILNRMLCHFFRANIELGMKIAAGLQVNLDANLMSHAVEN